MRKSEMSPRQLAARTAIVERLREAGWRAFSNENELFDEGMFVSREVALRYDRGVVEHTVYYRGDEEALYLGLVMEDDTAIELALRADEHLPRILDVIVAHQDRLDATNYREPIRELMQAGVEVFASMDGDNFARLKDEQN